ncbi:MAG: ankyrin repeat domain-containing protein [Planctomycetota bacterium]|jgi:cytohesin
MKIGRFEIKKSILKRFLLCFLVILILSLIYPSVKLFQHIREFYTFQCLMTLPRCKINLDVVDSAFSHRPGWMQQKDEFGWTVLHWSAIWCRQEVIAVMLENGADINARTTKGLAPLHLAMRILYKQKSRKFIEFLIENGADINIQDDYGWTPLHEAIVRGNQLGVETLISKGADTKAQNFKGDNALHIAIQCASRDIIELLLQTQEVQIDAKNNEGWSPLHFAAWTGRGDVVEILIKNGAEVNIKNNFNHTPLRTANRNGKTEIVELLRGYGGV